MRQKSILLIVLIFSLGLFFVYNKVNPIHNEENKSTMISISKNTETAVLAGGCFWGMEELLRPKTGVLNTTVGYTGGHTFNPTYQDIVTGETGHAEAVQVVFNTDILSYEELLKYYFMIHDPTTINRQGNDMGTQYRSAIFYIDESQKIIAERLIIEANNSGKFPRKLSTKVTQATEFYPAEEYHQDYLQKNPHGYTCHIIRPEQEF